MRTPATKELIEQHPRHAARARYIETLDGMPVWTNTETKYFRIGEEMFDSMCKELRRAQKFIFLEYFIIEEGVMWDTILDILREKAPPDWMCACCTTTLVRSARCRKTTTAI